MKDMKAQYRTVMDDHFPEDMTITLGSTTLYYKKRAWKLAGDDGVLEEKGLRYGENPGQEAAMYQLVDKLNTEDGLTVIMISHDVHAAAEYAHHILHISETCTFADRDTYLRSPAGQHYLSMEGGMHDGRNME